MSDLLSILYSFFATMGFAILYYAPKKQVMTTSLLGMSGWITFLLVSKLESTSIVPIFTGAFVVGIVGEKLAKIKKQPATIFIIPGIIPFVPGFTIYRMMYSIMEKSFDSAIALGAEAFFTGITIAAAIIIATSVARMIKF